MSAIATRGALSICLHHFNRGVIFMARTTKRKRKHVDAAKELNLFMRILSKIVLVIRLIRDIFLQIFIKKTK